MTNDTFSIQKIGIVRSEIKEREKSPKQAYEGGAPDVWIEIEPSVSDGLLLLKEDMEVILLTWLHLAIRDTLRVHRRKNKNNPLTGVFATRSPDRPNPIGLHRVKILEIDGNRLKVGPLEVVDGTPIIDIKSVLHRSTDY